MSGEERRQKLLELISNSGKPASGTSLAQHFHVSRQVIVQDIALLRAEGYEIISTNRGYVCEVSRTVSRVFYVQHTDDQIMEELNLIVDCGGNAQDVFVKHEIYGELHARLGIDSRKKASAFIQDIKNGISSPLNVITSGYHYHTVTAESEDILDSIEEELRNRGFLVEK